MTFVEDFRECISKHMRIIGVVVFLLHYDLNAPLKMILHPLTSKGGALYQNYSSLSVKNRIKCGSFFV